MIIQRFTKKIETPGTEQQVIAVYTLNRHKETRENDFKNNNLEGVFTWRIYRALLYRL
jgi:hypothetical protein